MSHLYHFILTFTLVWGLGRLGIEAVRRMNHRKVIRSLMPPPRPLRNPSDYP